MIVDALISQLERFSPLTTEERVALLDSSTAPQRYPARHTLLNEGERPAGAWLILSGFACRFLMLPGGQRQIIGFLLPGDLFDVRSSLFDAPSRSMATLSPVEATFFSTEGLTNAMDRFPPLMRGFWRLTAIEDATSHQWLLNLGHRSALERLAHLLCELFTRLHSMHLADHNSCSLPITQTDLADALALSPVHVNRTLMELRRAGLITLRHHHLAILDPEALQSVAGFKPEYLGLEWPASNGRQPEADVLPPARAASARGPVRSHA